ncbi:MAG: 50S ribosome-binding GTPase [Candidatus Lokiarchaeota archaeon]|nr:50S ribosome-binding GTPase [Candidatus Lokiarchaeota archaeon]
MGKKVVLLGRAGVGKSTLKEIIFEGNNPEELMIHSLAPTRGMETSIYSWLDIELSVFDTSGQELKNLLKDESEQLIAFGGVDIVIYIFDYEIWHSDSQEIADEIKEVNKIMRRINKQAQLMLIFHKIDLIPKIIRNNVKILTYQIQNIVNLPIKHSIYFTSIDQDYIYSIHNAFSEIISRFSEKNFSLKKALDSTISNFSECICYITDYNNSIIVQSKSNNFNINLIYETYRIFYNLSRDNKNSTYNDGKQHLLNVDDKILRMLMIPLEAPNLNLKLLVVATESLEEDLLNNLAKKILSNLNIY